MSIDSRRIACGTVKLLQTSNFSYSNGSSNNSCNINVTKKRPLNALQQIASAQQNLFIATVPEPKYMKEMTTAIMRVAAFHLICWLPFCLIQLMSSQLLESGKYFF
jgi:hypothetical protein